MEPISELSTTLLTTSGHAFALRFTDSERVLLEVG